MGVLPSWDWQKIVIVTDALAQTESVVLNVTVPRLFYVGLA